jgi:hypothetical protein
VNAEQAWNGLENVTAAAAHDGDGGGGGGGGDDDDDDHECFRYVEVQKTVAEVFGNDSKTAGDSSGRKSLHTRTSCWILVVVTGENGKEKERQWNCYTLLWRTHIRTFVYGLMFFSAL